MTGGPWLALFRLAVRAHPPEWRERYGAEAVDAFARGLRERWGGARVRYALHGLGDAVRSAGRERAARAGPETGAGPTRERGEGMVASLGSDSRYAVRRLRRAPGLTGAVAVILALAVGANAAVFGVLRQVVLAPLPYPDGDRLVLPRWTTTAPGVPDTIFGQWSWPKFAEFREGSGDVLDGFAGYARRSAAITDPGSAESVGFEFVTPGYFELLGVVPAAGRFFAAEEDGPLPPGVAVISHGFWTERFGGDPGAIGRSVTADGARLEIVGVAEEGFEGLTGGARLWIPVGQAREAYGEWATDMRGAHWFHAVARLRPGVEAAEGEARLAGLASGIDAVESSLVDGERIGVDLAPLRSLRSDDTVRRSVWLAMASALLVLLIGMTNVAALLLARGRREARETAVRLALGAPRLRLIRERLVEGLLLAAIGGGSGLLLAAVAMAGARDALPEHLFRGSGGDVLLVGTGRLGVDPGVALFGLTVAMLAGAVFAAAPAVAQSAFVDVAPTLRRAGGRSAGLGRARDGGPLLVGGQVALSVVLLVGAGLLIGTLRGLHAEQRGFDAEALLVLRYSLGGPDGGYPDQASARTFHARLKERLVGLPGVRSVALGTTPPLSGHYTLTHVVGIVGREPYAEGRRPRIGLHVAEGDLFATLGTSLVRGRTFEPGEATDPAAVVVISQRAADELFPDEDPIGREVLLGLDPQGRDQAFRVVGVVEDVLYSDPVEGMMPELYMPMGVWAPPAMSVMLRTSGAPLSHVPAAREALASLDPDIPFWQVSTGTELRGDDVADTRLLVGLLGVFAGLAMVLSATGLWAVVARAVAERRREIGLRMALGARPGEVEGLMFLQGLWPVVGGGALGLLLALLLAPRMEGVLFGVQPRSPAVFLGAAALLTGVALLATWLPARRAARVDPMEALGAD